MRAMMRLSIVLIPAVVALGCSDQYTETNEAHPLNWSVDHGAQKTAAAEECQACHGLDLAGGSVGVACSECHLEGPPFVTHSPSWGLAIVAHQTFALNFSWTGCAVGICHGADLWDGVAGPSCFEAFGCHPEGPPAPHPVPYGGPESHGLSAKSNLLYCRNCHGTPPSYFDGGFVTDPDILDGGGACSVCHPEARAHPALWQGADDPNSAYLATHQNVIQLGVDIEATCGLCHNTQDAGDGPRPEAPGCFSASFVNANDTLVPCHAEGP